MELIPLTDFDQRYFPEVTEDEKIDFILNTNKIERFSVSEDMVRTGLLMPQQADPLVSGQMQCITLMLQLAPNQDLIPRASQITEKSFNKQFQWLFNFHGNILVGLAQKGEKLLNDQDYPLKSDLGQYRTEDKVLGHRKMPDPMRIKALLVEAFKEYAEIHDSLREGFSCPQMLEQSDWKKLEKAIYTLNLRLCCIKPFKDGSNRVARLTENLLRLNAGLKFKVITDKDKLLKDIWEMQDQHYKSVD